MSRGNPLNPERVLLLFCKTVFECEHCFIDAFRHLTISGILFLSCLCQWVGVFPTSKQSMLVLNALLAGAWLPWLTVNVPDSLEAQFCQLLMHALLQTVLATGDCVSGRGCYSNKCKQGRWNDPTIAWGQQESLPGSTVGVEAARAAPGLSISLLLLEELPGFAASQVGQESREPSGFTFSACCRVEIHGEQTLVKTMSLQTT